jgi:tetratricopeptide (TPR) repeat protein
MPVRPPAVDATWVEATRARPSGLAEAGLGLFGLRRARLVGREDVQQMLWGSLRRAWDTRRPAGVVLSAAPGAGASAIARWLTETAHARADAIVLRADLAAPDALVAMVRRALRLDGLHGDALGLPLAVRLSELGLTGLAEVHFFTSLLDPTFEVHPSVLRGQTLKLVRALATRSPVVVWLDDVHRHDDGSALLRDGLELAGPVLFVATQAESAPSVAHPACRVVQLLPLDAASCSAMCGQLVELDASLAQPIVAASQGNPEYITQVLNDLVALERLRSGPTGAVMRSGEVLALPADLPALWRQRVQHVLTGRESVVDGLLVAAVLGVAVNRVAWQRACQTLGVVADVQLLDRLVRGGLMASSPDGWIFASPILPVAIRADLGHGVLASVHAACAPGTGGEARAEHLLRAGQLEDAVAALLSIIPTARPDKGTVLMERVESLIDRHPDLPMRLRMRAAVLAARAMKGLGASAEAVEARLRPVLDWPPLRSQAVRQLAMLSVRRGEWARAHTLRMQALDAAMTPFDRAYCHIELGQGHSANGRSQQAISHYRSALLERDELPPRAVASALAYLGNAMSRIDPRGALEVMGEFARVGGGDLMTVSDGAFVRGEIYSRLGDQDAAFREFQISAHLRADVDHLRARFAWAYAALTRYRAGDAASGDELVWQHLGEAEGPTVDYLVASVMQVLASAPTDRFAACVEQARAQIARTPYNESDMVEVLERAAERGAHDPTHAAVVRGLAHDMTERLRQAQGDA